MYFGIENNPRSPDMTDEVNDTLRWATFCGTPVERLRSRIYEAYIFAQNYYADVDEDRLRRGYHEAMYLASCLFLADGIFPEICVDSCGEFIFSQRLPSGYVDIGVSGTGELSYAVRNDAAPHHTAFDDVEWTDYSVPVALVRALHAVSGVRR